VISSVPHSATDIPQNHRGGNGIHRVFSLSVTYELPLAVARGFMVMRRPCSSSRMRSASQLVSRSSIMRRDADLFAEAVGKARGFFGHIAVRAVEAEGQTDNDLLDVVLANEFAETAHIFVAIDAFEVSWGAAMRASDQPGEANARTA